MIDETELTHSCTQTIIWQEPGGDEVPSECLVLRDYLDNSITISQRESLLHLDGGTIPELIKVLRAYQQRRKEAAGNE